MKRIISGQTMSRSRRTSVLVIALVAMLAGASPATAARGGNPGPPAPREHPGLTCAEEYADLPEIVHEWNGEGSYALDLDPGLPSACIDLRNGDPITLSVFITDTNGKSLSYNVADSRPGDDCTPWVSVDLTEPYEPFEHNLPAAEENACTQVGEGDFSDSDPALAVYMNASFRGKPAGALVSVTLTATPITEG